MLLHHGRPRAAVLLLTGLSVLALLAPPTHAVTGTLPGGTPISVTITSPPDGLVVDVPAGTTSVDISGSVTAQVSAGDDAPDTGIVYVIDLSESTSNPSGCGGNQNPGRDGQANTILDCQIAAIRALNDQAIIAGSVAVVGLVGFGTGAARADLSPATGPQHLAPPDQDVNATGVRDLDRVLSDLAYRAIGLYTPTMVGSFTNFQIAVEQSCGLASSMVVSNRLVVMLSDGAASSGGDAVAATGACQSADVDIVTFAVGSQSSCEDTGNGRGSLQQIAAATGQQCTQVTAVSALPDLVRDLVGSSLDDVGVDGMTVGGPYPIEGPATEVASFVRTLTPGANTITATATGTDRGGSGTVSDAVTVAVNRVPTVAVDGATIPEGVSATLTAEADDDDGDPLEVTWDLDGDGVFDDAVGVAATVPGPDGPASIPVAVRACDATACATASTTVEVLNVAPVVDAGPDITVNRNDLVVLSGTFSDPAGAADAPYAWDFAGLAGGTAAHGDTLTASTTFPIEGTYTLVLEVADDDGAAGSDAVTIEVLNAAPDCTAVVPSQASLWPPDHTMRTIGLSGATDPEGDALTVTIDSVFQDEPVDDGGSGSTGPDGVINGDGTVDLRAERSGTGDGRVYHVGYTVEDGHGGSCGGVVTVAVDRSRSRNGAAVDQGPLFDSTAS